MDLGANHLQQQQHRQQQHDLSHFSGHLLNASNAAALEVSATTAACAVTTTSNIAATALLFDGSADRGNILTVASTACPPSSSPSSSIFSTAQHDIYRIPNIAAADRIPATLDNIAGKLPKSKYYYLFQIQPS
ncbi:unnamed protein product [Gongylonema pulchrum]|uniref:Uncharacterized protein n=1 Tax=Gongylonema pulchrum TaxID=637853 RepID=A0A183DCC3_9BILA|nr:unnamed protein product [Gongylonema pulchrum]